jgi:peptidoglycan/LPS O-acetylase OafA/YrhL
LHVIRGMAQHAPAANSDARERNRGYRPELDVVRFLAFLLVFLFHALPYPVVGQPGWRVRLALVQECSSGLCLFFTLSAYLITSLLLAERQATDTVSVKKFYIRRLLRIWPLYFFGIAIGLLIAVLTHRRSDVTGFVWYLLFAGNFYCMAFGWLANPMSPLWSISIEEQFYLLWPWAMRWFSKRMLTMCALFFIVAANITLLILSRIHATDSAVWANTFVQFEMFAVGILLALRKRSVAQNPFGMGYLLVIAAPALWYVAQYQLSAKLPTAGMTAIGAVALIAAYGLIALGCAAILQGFCMIGSSRMPQWAVYLGKISYGLYVFHALAIQFARALFNSDHRLIYFAGSALSAFLLTVAAAVVSYHFLESPFLRLKGRFEIVHSRPI